MTLLDTLLADLDTEGDVLRTAVAGLDADGWATPTPAAGWSVATQVGHLAWTDGVAVLAARAHEDQAPWDELVLGALGDPDGFVDAEAHRVAADPDLLAHWDRTRADLADALRAVPDGVRLPWFGPPMSPTSMATARFMETWAHSLDVQQGLGLPPERTDRVRHVVELGWRTRGFSFATHGEEVPAEPVRLELTSPGGETWAWGDPDASETVTGSAHDLALLVTQRVHRDDTDLVATGPGATRWLEIAQAFAGPPGAGREAVGRS